MDHPSYLFIANSHPVARHVLIQPERATGSLKYMRHASFTILPGSTKFPAYSVDVYSPAPAKLHLPLTDLFLSKSPCVFELSIVAEPHWYENAAD
jgi:hypothetical protein